MIKTDSSLIIDTTNPGQQWCAYEHLATFEAGAPPQVIFVNACKLADVYRLVDANRNSEWRRIFGKGGHIMVRIIAIGEQAEVTKFAIAHMRSLTPMPMCNLKGYTTKGTAQRIECITNGVTYGSQKEAADTLGISGSAISRHLRGDLKHVGTYVFRMAS